jgi:WD40 repeat protein
VTAVVASACGFLVGLVLAATGLPVAPGTLTMQAVVNSGHRGAVLDIASDAARGLLFSAGEDGTLRVWDAASRTLLRRIAITRRMTGSVALDPAASRAAVVIASQVRSYAIEVWDWETAHLVYRIPLEGVPLFVRFSQSGSYLLCGETRWRGLRIFRASDGSAVPFHPEGFGMVGFAETSKDDTTLMTYRPAGKIEYWGLAGGSLLEQRETRPGLSGITITDDRRRLIGTVDDSVVGVDALTGRSLFDISSPGLSSMDASGDGARIACLSREGGLRLWTVSGESPSGRSVALDPGRHPRLVRWGAATLIVGGSNGEMDTVAETGVETAFARDTLSTVSGCALGNGVLAVATGDAIHVFSHPPSGSEHFSIPNPYGGPVGLDFADDGKLLVWRAEAVPGALGVVDLSARSFADSAIRFAAPILSAAIRDGRVFSLEAGGSVKVSDMATGALLFETRRPGATAITVVGPHTVLCGRTAGGSLGSSVVRIDTRTGEIAPVASPETFTFSLTADTARRSAYSLGVDREGDTALVRHSGPGLDSDTVLARAPGELLSASTAFDPADGVLYAALDPDGVDAWSADARMPVALPIRGAIALRAADGILVSLDKDSLLSLWDARAGRPLGDISLFPDDGWAVTLPDGSYTGSPGAGSRIAVFLESRLSEVPPQLTKPPAPMHSDIP